MTGVIGVPVNLALHTGDRAGHVLTGVACLAGVAVVGHGMVADLAARASGARELGADDVPQLPPRAVSTIVVNAGVCVLALIAMALMGSGTIVAGVMTAMGLTALRADRFVRLLENAYGKTLLVRATAAPRGGRRSTEYGWFVAGQPAHSGG